MSRPWNKGTACPHLRPKIAGQFDTFEDWTSHASRALSGFSGSMGEEVKAICIDDKGRRCNIGADFMRARDEGAFPVRYFIEMETATPILTAKVADWQDISTAPKDKTAVIIAVPTKDRDDWIIGEAYFDPENYGDGDWWWAGIGHKDHHGGPISDINHHAPEFWQPLPKPPVLATSEDKS